MPPYLHSAPLVIAPPLRPRLPALVCSPHVHLHMVVPEESWYRTSTTTPALFGMHTGSHIHDTTLIPVTTKNGHVHYVSAAHLRGTHSLLPTPSPSLITTTSPFLNPRRHPRLCLEDPDHHLASLRWATTYFTCYPPLNDLTLRTATTPPLWAKSSPDPRPCMGLFWVLHSPRGTSH